MYILSAPAHSGYRREFKSMAEMDAAAAEILHCDAEDIVESVSPDGGTVYYYASQAAADADLDGAYAVQYTER